MSNEQNVGWTEWSGWIGVDAPYTVMTTRAPAVLKTTGELLTYIELYIHII